MNRRSFLGLLAAAPVAQRLPLLGELEAAAQMERRGELHPLVGPYNYALKKNYSTVYRYLNAVRSEERRVGKECRSRRAPEHEREKKEEQRKTSRTQKSK